MSVVISLICQCKLFGHPDKFFELSVTHLFLFHVIIRRVGRSARQLHAESLG